MAIKFQTNVPVELALRELAGELVDSQYGGQQYRFRADIGDFYVSEVVGTIIHDRIRKLGIIAGEVIEICKREAVRNGRRGIQWELERVGIAPEEEPIEAPAAAPIAPVRMPPASAAAAAPKWAQALSTQTKQLLDVYAELVTYASEKYGNSMRPDDVRSLMTTTFINICKQNGGNANAA